MTLPTLESVAGARFDGVAGNLDAASASATSTARLSLDKCEMGYTDRYLVLFVRHLYYLLFLLRIVE